MADIKDIAKRAGVSISAVSKFFNNSKNFSVSKATRKRILQAAEYYKYVPNMAARALKSKKTEVVGLIVNHLDSYILSLVENIERLFAEQNYSILLGCSNAAVETELTLIERMHQRMCEKIFVISSYTPLFSRVVYERHVPKNSVVYLDSYPAHTKCPVIASDNYADAAAAARKLIARGLWKTYSYIHAGSRWHVLNERMRGFCDAVKKAGFPVRELIAQNDSERMRIITDAIRSRPEMPLLFFETLVSLESLKDIFFPSLAAPAPIGICGFDEPSIKFRNFHCGTPVEIPHIPFVYQDKEAIARLAVNNFFHNLLTQNQRKQNITFISASFVGFEDN